VGENVAFGLESRGIRGEELAGKVAGALMLVDLAGYERRRIGALSGGQQVRVALARALAPEPRVLLLDEPLSNLDPTLRERTRKEIREVIHRVGITTVLVTHEQEEAFDLGDRVALLREGRLEQFGTPDELYDSPATPFVAGFIGRSS
jgi:ABC-type Fe3+/spermidine/putrescine transport system ATPase subunit